MNHQNTNDTVVIVHAKRTAMGHLGGFFKHTKATSLGSAVIADITKTFNQSHQHAASHPIINEVIMGCVLPAGLGQAPARQAALGAPLSPHIPCTTINKMCGSGMKAVMLAYDAILSGDHDCLIAGGFENMSQAPYLNKHGRFGYHVGHGQLLDHMICDGLEDAYEPGQLMGHFAETCAEQYDISRAAMDEFAMTSLVRAKEANLSQSFTDEITPVFIKTKKEMLSISQDEHAINADPNKIPSLKPVFSKNGRITPANASALSDGAAALLIMRYSLAKQLNLTPLAKIVGHATFADQPKQFTTAPIYAIQKLLKKIQWTIEEVDLFEINEAFAVITLVAMQILKLSHKKVNLHGGACALGHPLGASGARILVTLLYTLRRYGKKRGIASLCLGGGEATAMAIETL